MSVNVYIVEKYIKNQGQFMSAVCWLLYLLLISLEIKLKIILNYIFCVVIYKLSTNIYL